MKRFIFIIIILFSAFHISAQAQNSSKQLKEKPEIENEMYVCPMHSNVTSDKPGSCTKCNMNLVNKKFKNYKGHETEKTQAVYSCPMHPEISSDKAGTCSKCKMTLAQNEVKNYKGHVIAKETNYVCPMHPELKSKQPGNCPACNMAMVEKKAYNPTKKNVKDYKGHVK